jgi:N-acyl-phosphatidylethanolamine-hydrolysing phospholipase D
MMRPHHRPGGGFRNPWPTGKQHGIGGLLKWMLWDRVRQRFAGTLPNDGAVTFPAAAPAFTRPRANAAELTLTWVGHSTFLMQAGGRNVLTDPVWGERASPVSFAGPKRRVPAAVAFDALPPIDLILISHDHYDHLDRPTVRRLVAAHPAARWIAPLGVRAWLERRGVTMVTEHDWWDVVDLGEGMAATCVPAQHFSGRGPTTRDSTLWCGWVVRGGTAESTRAIYYVGDTGLYSEIGEVGVRAGPFDAVLMPIGAYDPRWFMRPVHLDPEEAVDAYLTMGGTGTLVGMHWGTFKLTDEAIDEPPRRIRAAWQRAGLDERMLWVPRHGETKRIGRG